MTSPKTRRDLVALADYIARDNLDAAQESFGLLAESPLIGTSCGFKNHVAAEIRFSPVRGFRNYVIFCRPLSGGIDVARVLHGARDLETIFS